MHVTAESYDIHGHVESRDSAMQMRFTQCAPLVAHHSTQQVNIAFL